MISMISMSAVKPEQTMFSGVNHCNHARTELAATMFVRKLRIRSHLKGYAYLITAIVLGKNNPQLLHSLTSQLYPAVAAVYNTTAAAVERNIRTAIDLAAATDPERVQAVFYYHTRKPYISEVLALALETIRLEQFPDKDFSAFHVQG